MTYTNDKPRERAVKWQDDNGNAPCDPSEPGE